MLCLQVIFAGKIFTIMDYKNYLQRLKTLHDYLTTKEEIVVKTFSVKNFGGKTREEVYPGFWKNFEENVRDKANTFLPQDFIHLYNFIESIDIEWHFKDFENIGGTFHLVPVEKVFADFQNENISPTQVLPDDFRMEEYPPLRVRLLEYEWEEVETAVLFPEKNKNKYEILFVAQYGGEINRYNMDLAQFLEAALQAKFFWQWRPFFSFYHSYSPSFLGYVRENYEYDLAPLKEQGLNSLLEEILNFKI